MTADRPRYPTPWFSIHALTLSPRQLGDAREGLYHFGGRATALAVPVDWDMDPYDDRSWRYSLHALGMLEPILRLYNETADVELLKSALAFTNDYVSRCVRSHGSTSEFVWYDMAVSQRLCYLSFLVDEGARLGLTVDGLAQSCSTHAAWLMRPENYAEGHNHGLFSDAALAIAAKGLSHLPRSDEWRCVAERRFVANLRSTVGEDGVHLEHSPMYHFAILGLIERTHDYVDLGGAWARELLKKMRAAAPWFVMPDHYVPQLGDSNFSRVGPNWKTEGLVARGLAHFDHAGYQIVKEDSTYLIFSSGFHSNAHKHTDELSFEFFDRGRRILVDSGNYGYYYGTPGREYCVSARAHNTLVVNGADFGRTSRAPFGSATSVCGSANGWYMLSGRNPRLAPQQAEHLRFLFLLPGKCLIICDDLIPTGGWEATQVARHFHFDPALAVRWDDVGARFLLTRSLGFCAFYDFTDAAQMQPRLLRGRSSPPLQAFVYRSPRNGTPNPTAILQYREADSERSLANRRFRFRSILALTEQVGEDVPSGRSADEADAWIRSTVPEELLGKARSAGLFLNPDTSFVRPLRKTLSDAAVADLAARVGSIDVVEQDAAVWLVGTAAEVAKLRHLLETQRPDLAVRGEGVVPGPAGVPLPHGREDERILLVGPTWPRILASLPADVAARTTVVHVPEPGGEFQRMAIEVRTPRMLFVQSYNAADLWLARLIGKYAQPRHLSSDRGRAVPRRLDVAPDQWPDAFRFGVVQNPMDRLLWAFRELISTASGYRAETLRAPLLKLLGCDRLNFNEFAIVMHALPDWALPSEVRPQAVYLSAEGKPLVPVYRVESGLGALLGELRGQRMRIPGDMPLPIFMRAEEQAGGCDDLRRFVERYSKDMELWEGAQ